MYIELNMDRSGQDFLNCISIVSHKCLILITTKAFAPFIASAIRKTYQREVLIQERRFDYWNGSCGGGISGGPLKPQKLDFERFYISEFIWKNNYLSFGENFLGLEAVDGQVWAQPWFLGWMVFVEFLYFKQSFESNWVKPYIFPTS